MLGEYYGKLVFQNLGGKKLKKNNLFFDWHFLNSGLPSGVWFLDIWSDFFWHFRETFWISSNKHRNFSSSKGLHQDIIDKSMCLMEEWRLSLLQRKVLVSNATPQNFGKILDLLNSRLATSPSRKQTCLK